MCHSGYIKSPSTVGVVTFPHGRFPEGCVVRECGLTHTGTPRKRLSSVPGESDLSGCGMEQSMAGAGCSSEQDTSETSSSRGGSVPLSRPSHEAQSRSCSSWDGLPVCPQKCNTVVATLLSVKLLPVPDCTLLYQATGLLFAASSNARHYSNDLRTDTDGIGRHRAKDWFAA